MLRTVFGLFLAAAGYMIQEPVQPSPARTITIRLLDSRSGKPLVSNDVEIVIERHTRHIVYAKTSADGIAIAQIPSETSELSVYAQQNGWYLYRCDFAKGKELPFYDLNQILNHGIAANNGCSRRMAPAKPGEITLFLRTQTFWEKMRI